MTRLVFLSPAEKRKFDSPPIFTKRQRHAYFVVTEDIRRTLGQLRTTTNKVGFLLQLGYFRYCGKFFVPSVFRGRDIQYVKQLLGVTDEFNVDRYPSARILKHRSRILSLLDWIPFDESNATLIAERIQLLAQQQLKPEQVFAAAIDFCWKQRIELPTYHQLSKVITDSFNIVESSLLGILASELREDEQTALDVLLANPKTHWLPLLGQIKQVNQSLRAKDIQKNVNACRTLKDYFEQFRSVSDVLDLNQQATEYYAAWIQKATLTQVKQFPNPQKRYLYLLAFIKHQYYLRQVELRQRIEKQLNKVELANQFSKAVFFANSQEFQVGTKEEQEIATACKVLIQNAIVLWNYLYLSHRLSTTADPNDRRDMLEAITGGSIIAWAHVNMQGEYDFTRTAANDDAFDMPSILALKLG